MGDRLKRGAMIALGVLCVGIAAIGFFLPGIPTLGPLLCGSLLLARSHPELERRLVRNKFFAPCLPYIDGEKELSGRAKLGAATMMWTSILISAFVLMYYTSAPKFVPFLVIAAGFVGSFAIWRWGKGANATK